MISSSPAKATPQDCAHSTVSTLLKHHQGIVILRDHGEDMPEGELFVLSLLETLRTAGVKDLFVEALPKSLEQFKKIPHLPRVPAGYSRLPALFNLIKKAPDYGIKVTAVDTDQYPSTTTQELYDNIKKRDMHMANQIKANSRMGKFVFLGGLYHASSLTENLRKKGISISVCAVLPGNQLTTTDGADATGKVKAYFDDLLGLIAHDPEAQNEMKNHLTRNPRLWEVYSHAFTQPKEGPAASCSTIFWGVAMAGLAAAAAAAYHYLL